MQIINKSIPEPKSQATLGVTADGAITAAGLPVLVYLDADGWRASVEPVSNATVLNGKALGISTESADDEAVTSVVVAGKVAVATSAGTVGQVVTAITSAGSCTTQTFASATANIYGYYSAAKEIVLVG